MVDAKVTETADVQGYVAWAPLKLYSPFKVVPTYQWGAAPPFGGGLRQTNIASNGRLTISSR